VLIAEHQLRQAGTLRGERLHNPQG
jgi:hypothetical protein